MGHPSYPVLQPSIVRLLCARGPVEYVIRPEKGEGGRWSLVIVERPCEREGASGVG
jgi:hypothetical protein